MMAFPANKGAASGALLNATVQQAQGIYGHLCVALGLQQSQLCQERPAASKTRFHEGPQEKGAACPKNRDLTFKNNQIDVGTYKPGDVRKCGNCVCVCICSLRNKLDKSRELRMSNAILEDICGTELKFQIKWFWQTTISPIKEGWTTKEGNQEPKVSEITSGLKRRLSTVLRHGLMTRFYRWYFFNLTVYRGFLFYCSYRLFSSEHIKHIRLFCAFLFLC